MDGSMFNNLPVGKLLGFIVAVLGGVGGFACEDYLMRWFEERRIEWIAETLRVFGYINREHIEKKFGISTPQASHDLQEFQRRFPDRMTYNKCAKRYERIENWI